MSLPRNASIVGLTKRFGPHLIRSTLKIWYQGKFARLLNQGGYMPLREFSAKLSAFIFVSTKLETACIDTHTHTGQHTHLSLLPKLTVSESISWKFKLSNVYILSYNKVSKSVVP